MIQNNRTETEVLLWELMENPPYTAMTFQQIVRELRGLSENGEFADVEEGQLTKLLQHHANHLKPMKIQGKTLRPWLLLKGRKLENDEVREEVTKCGL